MADPWRGDIARAPSMAILDERLRNMQAEIREVREQNERWHVWWAERADKRHSAADDRIAKLEIIATRADTLRVIGAWVVSALAALAAIFSVYKALS